MTSEFISMQVIGDRQAALAFERFPDRLRDGFRAVIARQTAQLEAAVLAAVPRRTGRLASQVNSAVREGQDYVRGTVFIRAASAADARKAAALEYGSHRSITVKTHAQSLNHIWSRFVAPMQVMMKTYQRTTNIDPQRFLRGPLESLAPALTAELQAVADAEIAAGGS